MATQPSTEIATLPRRDDSRFALMQREATLFASSPLIPEHLRKGGREQAVANCYIALRLAETMGEDPMVVMQNIHVVSGKAGFSSQYMIARANGSGIFADCIDWEITGKGADLSITAFATLAKTERRVSVTVDMAMARAEGWTKNNKYSTMPEVMLRYRSAAFLVRFYAPQVMLGYHTTEELSDVAYAAGPDLSATPLTSAMLIEQAETDTGEIVEAETIDAETGEIIDEGPADSDRGETITLASAKAEIDAAELVADVNSRVSALAQHFEGEDADALRSHAMDKIAALKGEAS